MLSPAGDIFVAAATYGGSVVVTGAFTGYAWTLLLPLLSLRSSMADEGAGPFATAAAVVAGLIIVEGAAVSDRDFSPALRHQHPIAIRTTKGAKSHFRIHAPPEEPPPE